MSEPDKQDITELPVSGREETERRKPAGGVTVVVDAVLYTRAMERSQNLERKLIWTNGVVFGILIALWVLNTRN